VNLGRIILNNDFRTRVLHYGVQLPTLVSIVPETMNSCISTNVNLTHKFHFGGGERKWNTKMKEN
jgi:hypothetical protein